MNLNLSRNSRSQSTLVIANGGKAKLQVGGDYFYIYSQSGALTISVNGDVFSNCQSGLIHSGVPGRNDIELVEFYNVSGAAVTVIVIFGKGSQSVTGAVNLSAGDVALITPAAAVLTADFQTVNNASVAFNAKRSLSVTNTGVTAILVGGVSLPVGQYVSWSCERAQDTLPNKTVDTTGGGLALVVWTAA